MNNPFLHCEFQLKVKQSKVKKSKVKQSKAKQSKAKQYNAKQCKNAQRIYELNIHEENKLDKKNKRWNRIKKWNEKCLTRKRWGIKNEENKKKKSY